MARAASQDIVVLGSRRKARLEAITRRASAPQALARRARIVLLAYAGWPNARIAAELGCAVNTVRTWRRRFVRGGMPALSDRPRSGRPEVYGPGVRLAIVAAATSVPPEGNPAWTHALIAAELAGTGISASQAGRILADLELRPHRVRGWLNRARRRPVLGAGRRGLRRLPAPAAGHRGDLHRREDRDPGQVPQVPRAAARGRAARPAGSSSTSATAPSPSSPRCMSPPARSSPSRSPATTRSPSPASCTAWTSAQTRA